MIFYNLLQKNDVILHKCGRLRVQKCYESNIQCIDESGNNVLIPDTQYNETKLLYKVKDFRKGVKVKIHKPKYTSSYCIWCSMHRDYDGSIQEISDVDWDKGLVKIQNNYDLTLEFDFCWLEIVKENSLPELEPIVTNEKQKMVDFFFGEK